MATPAWTAESVEAARIFEAEASLHFFVRLMWPVLEPETPFTDGWWPRAWCEHLEAVTNGNITRLLGNCPPGSCKSLLTNVFWPAWVWGPRHKPSTRFLTAAYSQMLTERDNDRMRMLIQSPEYQSRWGRVFTAGDSKINYQNNKTGWKVASSVGGTITGMRGDIFICFPYDQPIQTERGAMSVGAIVDARLPVRVPSFNEGSGAVELKPVVGWHSNPGAEIIRLEFASGIVIRCTPNHRIRVDCENWKAASDIPVGAGVRTLRFGQIPRSVLPGPTSKDRADCGLGDPVSLRQNHLSIRRRVDFLGDFSGDLCGVRKAADSKVSQMWEGSVPAGVIDVLSPRAIDEVAQADIRGVPVSVTDLLSYWAWPDERCHHDLVDEQVGHLSVHAHIEAGIKLPAVGRFDDDLLLPIRATASDNYSGMTFDAPEVGDGIVRESDDGAPFLDRLIRVVHEGFSPSTYCLTVQDNHNMLIGDDTIGFIIVGNCDDPNNINESESKTIREATNRWVSEVLPTRLNSMERSAIVVIQQRTHEEDVTGFLLRPDRGGDKWTYVMVPMLYDPSWTCGETSIGWRDPRTTPGELFWPERFSAMAVASLRQEMTPYAFAGQLQQHPEPRGGAIIKRDWWKLYGRPDEDPTVVKMRFPAFSYLVASLDCALTDKSENDPSALVVLGVWIVPQTGRMAVMVVHCWAERLQINPLVRRVAETCDKYHVDRLIIENKANGHSVQQEIRRMYANSDWAVEMIDPHDVGTNVYSKIARVNSITHLFEEGMIWHPNTEWAEALIDECSIFPKGSHDDRVDALVHGIRHLRDRGILYRRQEERQRDNDIAALAHGQMIPRPLYES